MIVKGTIQPIRAKDLNLDKLLDSHEEITVKVPIRVPGVIPLDMIGDVPTEKTIARARASALQLIANMGNLPHSNEAGDLLAMAYTVAHYTKEK